MITCGGQVGSAQVEAPRCVRRQVGGPFDASAAVADGLALRPRKSDDTVAERRIAGEVAGLSPEQFMLGASMPAPRKIRHRAISA